MQLYQVDKLQESKENSLRNNYDLLVINNELSSALRSTGAQYQMQSQVLKHSNDEARGPVDGQQPQPVQTAPSSWKGEKRDTPPPGNYRSLICRVGAGLKWRDHSCTIGSHACWAGQYNGVRYLLQYVHWQTVRPRLKPIGEWEERVVSEQEKLQKKQMIKGLSSNDSSQMITGLSLNDSSESLEYDNWTAIRHTLIPCSQAGQGSDRLNGTECEDNGKDRGHPRSQQDTTAFQETCLLYTSPSPRD